MPERESLGYKKSALMWARILTGMTAWSFAAFSVDYKIHQNELLSSYGKDFIAPLIFYSFAQALALAGSRFQRFGKPRVALVAYGIYALGAEFLQHQSGNLNDTIGSRYDPYDILALGLGTAFAIGVNKYLTRRFSK